MSELSGKQVKSMKEAYASIYSNVNEEVSEEVSEENENESLMLEWYNALVEEGYIDGSKIEENLLLIVKKVHHISIPSTIIKSSLKNISFFHSISNWYNLGFQSGRKLAVNCRKCLIFIYLPQQ